MDVDFGGNLGVSLEVIKEKPEMILDYDNNLVSLEILDASRRVTAVGSSAFTVEGRVLRLADAPDADQL